MAFSWSPRPSILGVCIWKVQIWILKTRYFMVAASIRCSFYGCENRHESLYIKHFILKKHQKRRDFTSFFGLCRISWTFGALKNHSQIWVFLARLKSGISRGLILGVRSDHGENPCFQGYIIAIRKHSFCETSKLGILDDPNLGAFSRSA